MTKNDVDLSLIEPYATHIRIKRELKLLGDYLQTVDDFMIFETEEEIDETDESTILELAIANQIRTSFIMLLFSCFEKNIDRICEAIKERKKLQINRSDLSGGLIKSAKKYLQVFAHVDHSYIDEWANVEGLYDVRNILVHSGGNIKKAHLGSTRKLNRLLKMDIGLERRKDQISISANKFCFFALDSMIKLFHELELWHVENFVGLAVVI